MLRGMRRPLLEPTKTRASSKPIRWEQWLGLVERGRVEPDSLILERLNPPRTYKRAPGPGAVRRVEWKPLADKHLRNRSVIFHTDSAKSYKLRVDGVLHDRVVHAKKRVLGSLRLMFGWLRTVCWGARSH